jgi:hypothetical protein
MSEHASRRSKTPEELEQVREHNRKVLRELQFDSAKWLLVPRAIRALVPVLRPDLQAAAAELHKPMRSGAIPTATQSCRWRDGLQTSHLITRYPPPADWDAVSPESLIMGFREINEGDGNVVRCWDYIDLQYFNRWFSALAETPKQQTTLEQRRAAFERALQQDTTTKRQVARAIFEKKNPGEYFDKSPALLLKQAQYEKTWKAECEEKGIDPEKVRPPSRETVVRMIGKRDD